MRVRHWLRRSDEKIELNMTPMIDIVFQLLTFFIMSLNITAAEGDFQVRMPLAAPRPDLVERPPAIFRLRLTAGNDGSLRSMRLDERTLAADVRGADATDSAFTALHHEVLVRLGDERGPGSLVQSAEIEIDADYHLDYEHVIAAITAVSGYVAPHDDVVVKLIEKIRFAPARPAG